MSPTLLLFLISFITTSFARPTFGETSKCIVHEDVKCGQRPCPCEHDLTYNPKSWSKYLLWAINLSSECKCDILCSKAKEIDCHHGSCMGQSQGCKCHPCWSGPNCDQYVNKHRPKFAGNKMQVKIGKVKKIGQQIVKLVTKDSDSKICKKGKPCECADNRFKIVSGNQDGLFDIDIVTGSLILAKRMTTSKVTLKVSVSNPNHGPSDAKIKASFMILEITREEEDVEKGERHVRLRRSTSGARHSLMLTIRPALTTKYYFDVGDIIYFNVILSHNSSVTGINSGPTQIDLNSTYLQLNQVSVNDPSGVFNGVTTIQNGIKVAINKLDTGKHFTVNVSGTVKNTIGPLSNLFITGQVVTTTNGKGFIHNIKSSPVVYAVFPTVNLTRDVGADIDVYANATFNMHMEFPKLNYFLLAELTTNIEDFVFMKLKNAQVKNKGSGISYNGTATPSYYSSQGTSLTDRVVIDFGYLQCSSRSNNGLDIEFQLEVMDHPKLVNNSKHWMGVGLQAGYRVLWVEQQALTVAKKEPTLSLEISSSNVSQLTRFYIDDIIIVKYQINHTNTSSASAIDIGIKCSLTNLLPGAAMSSDGNGNFDVTGTPPLLNQGSTGTGTFSVRVPNTVTPLVELGIKCNMTYSNIVHKPKTPVSAMLTPAPMVGTPSIILSLLNEKNNDVRVGEKRSFSLKILLTKLISPLRIELVMPTAQNLSVFSIYNVRKAIIGKNIVGTNASAVPVPKKGTIVPEDHSTVIYDLGTARNPTGNKNEADNIVEVFFDVYVNDVEGVKNGSKFWVGAGVVGQPRMIWVGQISLSPYFSTKPMAILELQSQVSNVGDVGYTYSTFIKHANTSERWAYGLDIKYFLPPYIIYKRIINKPEGMTKTAKDGYVRFTIESPLLFFENLNFTFEVTIDKTKAPHGGRINVLVPTYLTYKDRLGVEATVVKATHTYFDTPVIPPEPPKPLVTPVKKYYSKGIFIHTKGSGYHIYVCIDEKFTDTLAACYMSTDKGMNWEEVDNRVASVVSVDDDGNLYGIARNKVAYLKYDSLVQDWVSVKEIKESAAGSVHPAVGINGNTPSELKNINGESWGATKDGLYFKSSGGNWKLKARWL